jgi:chorismate--pyruvate lyase
VNGVNPPPSMRGWLSDAGSLTAKLTARCQRFRVQCLHQRLGLCLADEAGAIGLAHAGRVLEREVLLRCDGRPMVFAHTVVPMSATAADWPLFSALGNRSLGSTLFGDPQVQRGALSYARVRGGHPLMQRARAALCGLGGMGGVVELDPVLYARRSLFRRKNGLLLVTEVFLPGIATLPQGSHQHMTQNTQNTQSMPGMLAAPLLFKQA